MRGSLIVLATVLANGCTHPGFSATSTADTTAYCDPAEPCGGGHGDHDVMVTIVLSAAIVTAIALVVRRYVVEP